MKRKWNTHKLFSSRFELSRCMMVTQFCSFVHFLKDGSGLLQLGSLSHDNAVLTKVIVEILESGDIVKRKSRRVTEHLVRQLDRF